MLIFRPKRGSGARLLAVGAALMAAVAMVTLTVSCTSREGSAAQQEQKPSATRSHPVPQGDLAGEFAELAHRLHAAMGLAVVAVGSAEPASTFGDWPQGPAWSTIKVPLVIAAYRQQGKITDQMKAAITESDNAAAEALWAYLGDPATAATKMQQVLWEAGDPTTVESRRLRAEFTIFGQTVWSLGDQARFTANAFCNRANAPIFALMGEIDPEQRWGLGRLPAAQFKGGWGPSPAGKYLVRQLGVLDAPRGKVAVAIAAEPESGLFDDGRHALDEAAIWLTSRLAQLPAGQCKTGSEKSWRGAA